MKISNIYIRNVKSVTEFTDNLTDPVGDEPLSSRVINGSHNIGCTTILDCVEELLMSLRSTRIEFREIGEAEMMAQSVKEDDSPEPVKPMPIKVKPFAHQVKGFNIALTLFKWVSDDE